MSKRRVESSRKPVPFQPVTLERNYPQQSSQPSPRNRQTVDVFEREGVEGQLDTREHATLDRLQVCLRPTANPGPDGRVLQSTPIKMLLLEEAFVGD
jgi:hypothetical protein